VRQIKKDGLLTANAP